MHCPQSRKRKTYTGLCHQSEVRKKKERLTEALGLYPFIHLPAALPMDHPVRGSLVLFPEAPLALRRLLGAPSVLKAFHLVVAVLAVRSLPHVALLEVADVNPLAARVRLDVRVLVFATCPSKCWCCYKF